MKQLVKLINEKNYAEADKELAEIIPNLLENKLLEMKKAVAAKMYEQLSPMGIHKQRMERLASGVLEATDPKEDSLSVERGTPQPKPNETVINKSEPGSTHYKNMEEEEQLDEARINIVKARIRGGKVQRRKKVSNVPGMTLRGGKLQRMSAAERRRRKMGARKGKMKRKAKMTRILMKRKRSLQKRKSLGL